MKKVFFGFILLFYLFMVSGCGQTGALYLLPKEHSFKKQSAK
jgi:predicted small lipoprotein YifL